MLDLRELGPLFGRVEVAKGFKIRNGILCMARVFGFMATLMLA